jgi:predicted GIY-YIG superfamily endonuclease
MNLDLLIPFPSLKESFHLSREKYISEKSGCYVLTTFSGLVLYIGLAKNLRRRMNDHLKNSEKTTETASGRAVLFHWIESDDINKVERTWLNIHIANEGSMPKLNKIFSPTAT